MEGQFAPGLLVYGVPVGSDLFVTKMLDNKVKEIEANAEKAIDLLSHDKQALWTVLRSSIQHQFDYWLMLVHPSLTEAAARKLDMVMWRVLENLVGHHIPEESEELGWDFKIDVPVDFFREKTFQSLVGRLPIKLGGLGLRSQTAVAPVAYLGGLEQTIPFFVGEKGVCPALAHLVGDDEAGEGERWKKLVDSGCRTGREVARGWDKLQVEARQCSEFLGDELEGSLAVEVEGFGEGSTDGSTRKKITHERE